MNALLLQMNKAGEVAKAIPEIIGQASRSPLGMVALLAIIVGAIAFAFFRHAGEGTRIAIFVLIFAGVVAFVATYVRTASETPASSTYRVRAIVLDTKQTPISDAKVWSSVGGEPMRVEGGWLFVIPAETRPLDGKLTIYAGSSKLTPPTAPAASADVQLGADRNPTVTLHLPSDPPSPPNGNGRKPPERSPVPDQTITIRLNSTSKECPLWIDDKLHAAPMGVQRRIDLAAGLHKLEIRKDDAVPCTACSVEVKIPDPRGVIPLACD
jgi:hypothetical protein